MVSLSARLWFGRSTLIIIWSCRMSSFVFLRIFISENDAGAISATDQVRACHQPQDGQGSRPRRAPDAARPRRRGDRVRRRELIATWRRGSRMAGRRTRASVTGEANRRARHRQCRRTVISEAGFERVCTNSATLRTCSSLDDGLVASALIICRRLVRIGPVPGVKKATVEGSLVLTASALVRKKALVPGAQTAGSWGWSYEGEDGPHATIRTKTHQWAPQSRSRLFRKRPTCLDSDQFRFFPRT
jgi:hypothetical protein